MNRPQQQQEEVVPTAEMLIYTISGSLSGGLISHFERLATGPFFRSNIIRPLGLCKVKFTLKVTFRSISSIPLSPYYLSVSHSQTPFYCMQGQKLAKPACVSVCVCSRTAKVRLSAWGVTYNQKWTAEKALAVIIFGCAHPSTLQTTTPRSIICRFTFVESAFTFTLCSCGCCYNTPFRCVFIFRVFISCLTLVRLYRSEL